MIKLEWEEGKEQRERERERESSNLVALYAAVWYVTSRTCVLGGLDGTSDAIDTNKNVRREKWEEGNIRKVGETQDRGVARAKYYEWENLHRAYFHKGSQLSCAIRLEG